MVHTPHRVEWGRRGGIKSDEQMMNMSNSKALLHVSPLSRVSPHTEDQSFGTHTYSGPILYVATYLCTREGSVSCMKNHLNGKLSLYSEELL